MKNAVLEDIANYAKKRLTAEYGFCGVALSETSAFINSGNDTSEITIKIEEKREEGAA